MTIKKIVLVVALLTLTVPGFAYTGSLSSPVGIIGQEAWLPISMTWNVTKNPDQSYRYEYDFICTGRDVSHFIIETSDNFTADDILEGSLIVYAGTLGDMYIQLHEPSAGNPDMPGDIYGIKFDDVSGRRVHFSFDSWRIPVWGDFYAKDGKAGGENVVAWNAGFSLPDPLDPARDGTIDYKILRPDTVVPEPSALLGLGTLLTGAAGMFVRRRK